MVLKKSVRVWQKYRPRSVMLESKDVPEEALLFESEAIAILCEFQQSTAWCPSDMPAVEEQLEHVPSIALLNA